MKSPLSITLQVLCCISVVLRPSSSQVDKTREPGAIDKDVTEASIRLIIESGVFFTGDQFLYNVFLRRIARVESRDGFDIALNPFDPSGGIWQVSEHIFEETINTGAYPKLIDIYDRIWVELGVNWTIAKWEDLTKPLYSALAARIFLEIVDEPIPPISDHQGQAEYWNRHYKNNSADPAEFVTKVGLLDMALCPVNALDLAFVFDSSGSIGLDNFELEKNFAINVLSVLTIGGQSKTRIAAITYSTSAEVSFYLNASFNESVISQSLRDVRYIGHNTNTAHGLELLRSEIFTPAGGVRDSLLGIPRVAIVLTDGKSNVNGGETIPNAHTLHAEGVIVIAVGVGDGVSQDEIDGIASKPKELYAIHVDQFNETLFADLEKKITLEICEVIQHIPTISQPVIATTAKAQRSFFSFQVPLEGMTIQLQQQTGEVVLYTSKILRNPNSAFYDDKIEGNGAVFISPNKTSQEDEIVLKRAADGDELFSETIVYVTIEGVGNENSFILNTTFGNTVPTEDTLPTSESFPTTSSSSNSGLPPAVIISGTAVGAVLLCTCLAVLLAVPVCVLVKVKRARKKGYTYQRSIIIRDFANNEDLTTPYLCDDHSSATSGGQKMKEQANKEAVRFSKGRRGSGQGGSDDDDVVIKNATYIDC